MKLRKTLLPLLVILCLFLLTASICNESLPTRVTPDQVYSVKLDIITPNVDNIRRNTEQVAAGKGSLGLNITVTSVFDETLTDTVQVEFGSIDIYWVKRPAVTRTIPLTLFDEAITREFLYGGIIVFDPADSVLLPMIWHYFRDDNGTFVWEHESKVAGPDGDTYPPMEFVAQARVQFFDQTAAVYSDPIRFRVCFYDD